MPELVTETLSTSSNPLLRFLFTDFGEDMVSRAKTVRAHGKSRRNYGKSKHANDKSRHGGANSKHGNKSRRGAPKLKTISVASSFVVSLRQLMHKLGAAQPHFVRCIKPNAVKKAGIFDGPEVLRQMR